MSLPNSVRVRYEALRSLDWALITANYVAVGSPFENPIRLLKISNFTDSNLIVSFNGLEDHDIIAANSYSLYDYGSNRANQGGYFEIPEGDRFLVKAEGALPTRGLVYVTTFYASNV